RCRVRGCNDNQDTILGGRRLKIVVPCRPLLLRLEFHRRRRWCTPRPLARKSRRLTRRGGPSSPGTLPHGPPFFERECVALQGAGYGTKRTSRSRSPMSASRGEADAFRWH